MQIIWQKLQIILLLLSNAANKIRNSCLADNLECKLPDLESGSLKKVLFWDQKGQKYNAGILFDIDHWREILGEIFIAVK